MPADDVAKLSAEAAEAGDGNAASKAAEGSRRATTSEVGQGRRGANPGEDRESSSHAERGGLATVHFFHGDKGGSGKSFAAMAFVDWLVERRKSVPLVIDADMRNPEAHRMFESATRTALVKPARTRRLD